jgi:glucose dehydrogenase
MRTRKFDYLDTKTGKPVYSFQVRHNDKWHNVTRGNQPLLFHTEQERDRMRLAASKLKP